MDIRHEDVIPISAQELWRVLQTSEFDDFVAREYELKAYREIEKQVSNNLIERRLRIVASADLSYIPFGLAHKILDSNEIIYEEIQGKYLDRYEMYWKDKWIEPVSFRDKIQVSGKLQLIPIDDARCKLIREGSVHIKIFGVGLLLEGMAAKQVENISKKFARVVAKWGSKNAGNHGP
jgi:hypothetical protein